jgi:DNA-directed RNA polymerase specialized sigma24 family protein
MLRLSVEGFEGTAWREVSRALAEYGHAVILAWILTGMIFEKCRSKGVGGGLARPLGWIVRQEAEDLTQDTVAEAIVHFRDQVLSRGRWNPARGASLSTFFVGNCLLQFPNLYRRWWRGQAKRRALPLEAAVDPLAIRDPEEEAVERVQIEATLRALDQLTRRAVRLRAMGFSIEEIAKLTETTPKAVESRLYRLHVQMRRLRSDTA